MSEEKTGEVINLRSIRKEKARAAASKEAAAARAKSGRTRAERSASGKARALEEKRLDEHQREAVPGEDISEDHRGK